MRKIIALAILWCAVPAWAEVYYLIPAELPQGALYLVIDDENRKVALVIWSSQTQSYQTETLTFTDPPAPGTEFESTDLGGYQYLFFRHEYAPDDYRTAYAMPSKTAPMPVATFSAMELQYPGQAAVNFQNMILVARAPSPVQPVTFTRDDLLLTGCIAAVPGAGDITIQNCASMAPADVVTVAPDETAVDLDGLSTLSQGFSVTAPNQITEISIEFDTDPGDKTIVALVRQEGAGLDFETFPWSVVTAVGRVLVAGGQSAVSGLRKFVILPLQGYDCDYSHPALLSGGTIVTTVYKSESCEAEPWWVLDIVAGADKTRLWAASEQFQLDPVQKFIVLSGGTAPAQASSIDGVGYLNRAFFESMPSALERKGVIYHETAHSVMDYLLPESLFSRNRHVEATATAAEQRIDPENISWLARYPSWNATDIERGLNAAFNPNSNGMYNPFFVLDMYRRYPDRDILKDFYALGAPDFIAGNGIAAWMAALQVSYTELQSLFGEAASICHQNISPMQNVFGLCGDGTLAIDTFTGPTQIQVGETVLWQHAGGDVTVHIEGNPAAPADSLVTMMAAEDPDGWSVSFNGFLTGDYPLGDLPSGPYAITATSLEGVNYDVLDEYVTVEIERDGGCGTDAPWLFDGYEAGNTYTSGCSSITTADIYTPDGTKSCPGAMRGFFKLDVRVPDASPWPANVVGSQTGGSLSSEYWPQAWDPGVEMDLCDRPFGSFRTGVPHPSGLYHWQQITWVWDCVAAGNCNDPDARPPVW